MRMRGERRPNVHRAGEGQVIHRGGRPGVRSRSPLRNPEGGRSTRYPIKQEKPYFVEGLIDPRDFFRIFIVQPRRLFPRARAQSGAFLVAAHHKRFDFEFESEAPHDGNVECRPNNSDVPYNYYRMTVKGGRKKCILKELKSMNISEDTLCPELEKSAEAIVKENECAQSSRCCG